MIPCCLLTFKNNRMEWWFWHVFIFSSFLHASRHLAFLRQKTKHIYNVPSLCLDDSSRRILSSTIKTKKSMHWKKKFINLSNACACLEMVSLTHFAWNHRDVFYARLSSFILLVLVSGGFAKPTNINYLDDCVRTVSTNVLSVNYTDEQGQVSADFFSWTW